MYMNCFRPGRAGGHCTVSEIEQLNAVSKKQVKLRGGETSGTSRRRVVSLSKD